MLGEYDHAGEALFDEYGNLEPRRGSPQITPLIRLGRALHGAPASASIKQSLAGGSLPIPTVEWTAGDVEIRSTALAHAGLAVVEYRVANRSAARREGRAGPRGAPGPDRSLLAARRPRRHQFHCGRGRRDQRQRPALRHVLAQARLVRRRRVQERGCDPAHRKGTDEDSAQASLRLRPPQRGLRIRLFPRARRGPRGRRVVADAGRRRAAGGGVVRRVARRRGARLAGEDRPAEDHGRRPRR